MAPSHQPLPKVAPHPALAQRPTSSSRQAVRPTRSSVYPTTSPNKLAGSANWQPKSENRREMSTSLPASPRLPSSAQPNLPTRDTPPSSPTARSTSATNRTPSSPSSAPPSYTAGVNLERMTCGASLLSRCPQRQNQHSASQMPPHRIFPEPPTTRRSGLQPVQAQDAIRTGEMCPRRRWFPNQADVVQCHQEQAVCVVARTDA